MSQHHPRPGHPQAPPRRRRGPGPRLRPDAVEFQPSAGSADAEQLSAPQSQHPRGPLHSEHQTQRPLAQPPMAAQPPAARSPLRHAGRPRRRHRHHPDGQMHARPAREAPTPQAIAPAEASGSRPQSMKAGSEFGKDEEAACVICCESLQVFPGQPCWLCKGSMSCSWLRLLCGCEAGRFKRPVISRCKGCSFQRPRVDSVVWCSSLALQDSESCPAGLWSCGRWELQPQRDMCSLQFTDASLLQRPQMSAVQG